MNGPTLRILGLDVPDAGPLFLAVLAIHVVAGLVAVVSGAVAAASPKRVGRHPTSGRVYVRSLYVLFASAVVLAVIRWPHDNHLVALGAIALAGAVIGVRARRRRAHGWLVPHVVGMGTSYIAMLTAFYVDNGPQLPLWNRLPTAAFWLLPTIIGGPIIAFALIRHRASDR
ncbi:MAG: DUF2306 domain-containing protein [Pseudomonadota bacterium]|nr:DUF2306 domain-containing protein [Pseudomonadota bacterium]